ncbi:heat stress transcription factor A-4a-like [Vicia villosa]|uniref:heat stress transcription factor A-4a-like n=1 Tax=Vicia villosa TaxID=3911 RepID=UPI00273AB7DA|nr:heat stress transcription factor A-4a-like [Vicia villosa]
MASSSNVQRKASSSHQVQQKKYANLPLKSCSITYDELEVLCETMVDFENLMAHNFKTKTAMLVQNSSELPPQKKPPPSVIPSSSTTTNRNRPLLSTPVLNPQPLNAISTTSIAGSSSSLSSSTIPVRTGLDTLKAAHDSKMDHVATGKLWKIFEKDIQIYFLNIQKRCLADAFGSSGYFLELDDGCPVMEEVQRSLNSISPFLSKTYMMVSDPSTNAIVSWSSTSRSFVVWNQPDFSKNLLPKFFKHNNFSSFVRQLNTYGFRKVGHEQWEFANEDFVRDQPHRLKKIHRRKAVFSHSRNANGQRAAGAAPLTESERRNYKAQIEKLRQEKEQLLIERQKQEEEWKQNEMQLHYSKDRLQQLELNQQSLLASVGQVLQKSAEDASLQPLSGDTGRKRSYLPNAPFNDLSSIETRKETSPELARENAESMNVLSVNMERLDLLESSLSFWENFVKEVRDTSYETRSNLDFDDSMNRAHSPVMSGVQIGFEDQPESSGNEINSLLDIVDIPDLDPLELDLDDIFVRDPVAPEPAVIAVPDPDPVAPGTDVIVVPDSPAPEPAVTAVPDLVAPEPPVIMVPDSPAPEPAVTVIPDSAAPNEQPVETILGTNEFNIPFWQKLLMENPDEDESESASELSKYCWSRRSLKPRQIDKAGKA